MAFTRTRIWRGGNANFELDGAAEQQDLGSVPLTPVPASPASAGPRRTPASTPADAPPNLPPDAGYIPGFAPGTAREQAATRFLPIEELFPELASDPAPHASQPARAGQRGLIETPTGLRGAQRVQRKRWPIVALALASVTLGATLWSSDLQLGLGAQLASATQERTSRPSSAGTDRAPVPPPAAEPRAEAPASAAPAATEDAVPAAPARPEGAEPLPPGLERAAIDALVAGDFARAEKLYARLARGAAPEPIREALRILSSQQDAHGP